MSALAWRRLLLALCAFAGAQLLFCVWVTLGSGNFPVSLVQTAPLFRPGGLSTRTPFIDSFTLSQGSAAQRAGIKRRDSVDLRALSPGNRFTWYSEFVHGAKTISLPVTRNGAIRRLNIATRHLMLPWPSWLFYLGELWMLVFAALIAWRRSESAEVRTLALLLVLWPIGYNFYPSDGWITPWPLINAFALALGVVLISVAWSLLARFAMLFSTPQTSLRRALAWLSYLCNAVAALYGIAYIVGIWTLAADPMQSWYSGTLPQVITGILPLFFPITCLLVTVIQTRGKERARVSWAGGALGLFYLAYLASNALVILNASANGPLGNAVFVTANLSTFVAPMGLTYAFLNRRLLDIGFALNRAVVFSTVSIIIVGIFVLAEWGLSEWFSSASHTTNILISATLALGLGLSVRVIHQRADRVLDTLFFRKRHEDEQALRTFAHEAAYITDAPMLLERTVRMLEQYADASFVTIALDSGIGLYGDVSENDPAIVALRAGRKMLDLHTIQSDFRGEFAYPMMARGRLVGALVLGPKHSGDSYAPDESDAITQLAHGVADACDVLTAKENAGTPRDALLLEVRDAVRSLPDAIAARLREG